MLADLDAGLHVDAHRIYASGFSNGAGLAARLARRPLADVRRRRLLGRRARRSRSRPRRGAFPTYSTLGSLDDRVLDKQDPPLTELPMTRAQILANPVLGGYLERRARHARPRRAPPPRWSCARTRTTFRWPAAPPAVHASRCSRGSSTSTRRATTTTSPRPRSSGPSSPSIGCPENGGLDFLPRRLRVLHRVTHILVVANQSVATPALLEEIERRSASEACEISLLIPDAADGRAGDWTLRLRRAADRAHVGHARARPAPPHAIRTTRSPRRSGMDDLRRGRDLDAAAGRARAGCTAACRGGSPASACRSPSSPPTASCSRRGRQNGRPA